MTARERLVAIHKAALSVASLMQDALDAKPDAFEVECDVIPVYGVTWAAPRPGKPGKRTGNTYNSRDKGERRNDEVRAKPAAPARVGGQEIVS